MKLSLRRKQRPGKPRVLLIADVPNWIFMRHCQEIKKRLSDEFEFTIKIRHEPYNEDEYDLIYPLEFNLVTEEQMTNPKKYVTGIRSHISWNYLDFQEFTDTLNKNFLNVHASSQRLVDMLKPFVPKIVRLEHGIDLSIFKPSATMQNSPAGTLVLGFAGNRNSSQKKFKEYVEPLGNIEGVELAFCGYDSKNLSIEEMPDFYKKIDAYVCASDSEGHCNSIVEAAAMGIPIITTNAGTVPEFLENEKSALIIEQELPNFINATIRLRDNLELRRRLAGNARPQIEKYDWNVMAERYGDFFKQSLDGKTAQARSSNES